MDNKIIAIIKQPYEKPQTVTIEKGLKTLQDIVRGRIDGFDLPDVEGVAGYANDEGLLDGLEPNLYRPEYHDALVGPIVFTGLNDEGDDVSLTPEQVKKVNQYIAENYVDNSLEFMINVKTDFAHYKPKKQAEM